jgi:hypothetical protein
MNSDYYTTEAVDNQINGALKCLNVNTVVEIAGVLRITEVCQRNTADNCAAALHSIVSEVKGCAMWGAELTRYYPVRKCYLVA